MWILDQEVLVLVLVVLVLVWVPVAMALVAMALRYDQSGSPSLLSESCNQTSRSNALRPPNSMSTRCIRHGSGMLCNNPCANSLDQCRHR